MGRRAAEWETNSVFYLGVKATLRHGQPQPDSRPCQWRPLWAQTAPAKGYCAECHTWSPHQSFHQSQRDYFPPHFPERMLWFSRCLVAGDKSGFYDVMWKATSRTSSCHQPQIRSGMCWRAWWTVWLNPFLARGPPARAMEAGELPPLTSLSMSIAAACGNPAASSKLHRLPQLRDFGIKSRFRTRYCIP